MRLMVKRPRTRFRQREPQAQTEEKQSHRYHRLLEALGTAVLATTVNPGRAVEDLGYYCQCLSPSLIPPGHHWKNHFALRRWNYCRCRLSLSCLLEGFGFDCYRCLIHRQVGSSSPKEVVGTGVVALEERVVEEEAVEQVVVAAAVVEEEVAEREAGRRHQLSHTYEYSQYNYLQRVKRHSPE